MKTTTLWGIFNADDVLQYDSISAEKHLCEACWTYQRGSEWGDWEKEGYACRQIEVREVGK